MKKLMVLMICVFCFQMANAQVKFGLRAGISTTNITSDQIKIGDFDDVKQLGISVAEANYGIHFGFVTQAKIGNFFIQPEVLFNSNSVDFNVENFSNGQTVDAIKTESYQYVDIPLMIGYKLGPLRLQGGPVSHVFINSRSELFDISGYSQKFDEMTWGWQAGLGLDIWKLMLDFKYEGNFNKYGDHIVFGDQAYNFDQSQGRVVMSLGYTF